jgi:hypothetical protein
MKSSWGCRDSLSTDLQHNNPVPGQPHNHSPEESSVNLTRLRNNMQEKALSTHNAWSCVEHVWYTCNLQSKALNHLCYSLGSPFGTDEQFSKPSLKYKFCKKQQVCSQKPYCKQHQEIRSEIERKTLELSPLYCPDMLYARPSSGENVP